MGTRERDEQAEQDRERLQQQQQEERLARPPMMQAEGEDESINNPVIINK